MWEKVVKKIWWKKWEFPYFDLNLKCDISVKFNGLVQEKSDTDDDERVMSRVPQKEVVKEECGLWTENDKFPGFGNKIIHGGKFLVKNPFRERRNVAMNQNMNKASK